MACSPSTSGCCGSSRRPPSARSSSPRSRPGCWSASRRSSASVTSRPHTPAEDAAGSRRLHGDVQSALAPSRAGRTQQPSSKAYRSRNSKRRERSAKSEPQNKPPDAARSPWRCQEISLSVQLAD
jgi:hypothetical protein